ncbi:MAG: hypothetical protein CMI52_03825 [Parcubacteria group bacterium]|nr:hypothetical protein [Parcubacteria group bacterium]
MSNNVVLRFEDVVFEYTVNKPLLDEASFAVREGSKITLMGQNGAGKSTMFGLIRGDLKTKEGKVHIGDGVSIGSAMQTVDRNDFELTVEDYFKRAYEEVPRNVDVAINQAMDAVNLVVKKDLKVGFLSGGQQARLLLAYALLQHPDILLLDEPTNNLDQEGIEHLISFLVMYDKTVIVISHDADFLNCFTEGVLYLDINTRKVEKYNGDYYTVVEEISKRIEREKKKNAQLEKRIQDRKEKASKFAFKGGKMRKLAKKMKDETVEMEENKVEVRREDKIIYPFVIPNQDIVGDIVKIDSVKVIRNHEPKDKKVEIVMRQNTRLLISGPNGIGKSTLLRNLVDHTAEGTVIKEDTVLGYYSQDFSTLNYDDTVFDSLENACALGVDTQEMRRVAAGFLITGNLMGRTIAELSEGQKGLLSFARLVVMQPGLLVLDEPTNHINFRHIPIIAKALNEYKGALILISHMPDFVEKIRMDEYLDLGKLK